MISLVREGISMRYWLALVALVVLLGLSGKVMAAEHERGAASDEHAAVGHAAGEADAYPHPTIAKEARWAGVTVIIILALFLAAAVIGPVVRAYTPEEVPPAHSHDEPPGTSHHHGSSGTHAEEPHH
jgi:hypothetical protein